MNTKYDGNMKEMGRKTKEIRKKYEGNEKEIHRKYKGDTKEI